MTIPTDSTKTIIHSQVADFGEKARALLKELGFVPHPEKSHIYYCEAENWTVVCSHYTGKDPDIMRTFFSQGEDNLEAGLRKKSFPYDRVLRLRRLRALIS